MKHPTPIEVYRNKIRQDFQGWEIIDKDISTDQFNQNNNLGQYQPGDRYVAVLGNVYRVKS